MPDYKWYEEKHGKRLDYSRLIVIERADLGITSHEILLPVQGVKSYDIVGYDWFNITNGYWSSCRNWPTPEDAIKARRDDGYKVVNSDIYVSM